MIVAFMGNDGSGKTTVAKEIKKVLEKKGHKVDYQPGFDHVFLDKLLSLWGRIARKDTKKMTKEYLDTGKKKKRFLFKIWPYFVFLECCFIYLVSMFKRKTIVIFDRYFYDYLISYEELGYSSSFIRKLFLFLPKPDVGLVFDVSPLTAYKRKKADHRSNLDYYKRQRRRYLKMAKVKSLPVINTEETLDRTVSDTLEFIAKKIKI